jgi:Ser/Thr protein kinase RdoA (MazF antagonist)
VVEQVLQAFGLNAADYTIGRIGTGHINHTYRLTGHTSYILQRVNKNIFTKPERIASNLRIAADYLRSHAPGYLFLAGIRTPSGEDMVYDAEGYPWRVFPYIANTITLNRVGTAAEAYNAAAGFALLAKNLSGCDVSLFEPTIERFLDLAWRYEQFETALQHPTQDRLADAADAVQECQRYAWLVEEYTQAIRRGDLPLRILHNDTKINNILFDATTREAVCVIDLDTLMPGYFINDFGDMVRTCVSPVDEEERNVDRIMFRRDVYTALERGYLAHMGDVLHASEKRLLPLAGMMMTYITALRMLTDFLNGNIYYQISYADQNLVRARNQLRLLDVLRKNLCDGRPE